MLALFFTYKEINYKILSMKNKTILLPIILVASLSSCDAFLTLKVTNYQSNVSFEEIKKDEEGDGFYRLKEYQSIEYGKEGNKKTISSLRDIYSSGVNHYNAPSIGEVNALVIPVNFTDSNKEDNEKQKMIIHNAFFGERKMTTFESLSSFYDYSSYGQLKFNGFVTDFYDYPFSSSELGSGTSSVSSKIAGSALSWFYQNYPDLDKSKFDADNDSYIDALFIIYNHEISESSSSLWWAYADHMNKGTGGNDNAPYGSSYAWISYDFLKTKKVKSETHVPIHESGHLFGLEDYYNTNESANFQPTGYVDMMDRNIGDHTAYSKMLLNWTTPYVMNGNGSLTLKPFATSGDLLLLPTNKGWNKTPYDEYLLLEYYTPSGLYKKEAGTKYVYKDNKVFTFLDKPGLKVYHVDSRIGYFDSRFGHNLITVLGDDDEQEKLATKSNFCIDFAYSNTISDINAKTKPVLYHLLERSGENTLLEGKPFESSSLFKSGDSFGQTTFTSFHFNNGSPLTYTFKIKQMNNEGITIEYKPV